MPTTEDELTWARSYIGNVETEAEFDERFDRLTPEFDEREDALAAAVHESLRERLSVLVLDQPGSVSLPGVSASWGENIRALREMIGKLEEENPGIGAGSVVAVTKLEREGPSR